MQSGSPASDHEAPVVATGAKVEVVGVVRACSAEAFVVFVDMLAAQAVVELVAAFWLGVRTAMAAAPIAVAAPAPRVMAETQASPLLRARCRAGPEVGELVMVLQSCIGWRESLRCSWSMGPHSGTGLSGL